MKIAFLVPGPITAISGGYGYDRRLLDGFSRAGHEVQLVELNGTHPLPDDAARASAVAALAAVPQDARIIIDGLGLPAFEPLLDELEKRRAIGLIHHPTATYHIGWSGARPSRRRPASAAGR